MEKTPAELLEHDPTKEGVVIYGDFAVLNAEQSAQAAAVLRAMFGDKHA